MLAEARLHLARTLPDNFAEHHDMVEAVAWLGGDAVLGRLKAATAIAEARLP
jgi:hypothetical protein